ncbi:hypothetical protein EP073_01330 [Geovibrio thiophilus]|uniref:Class I SAM-dependent methyltransferase n=1 Tax=Geovibrio thiophilus TaxID=139438 RepID=A0A3R6AWF3_9BACT|nr:class I SAM-dependent methyltransferase [Geovibrio thiophilus]QAR32090.1 hypothetical protein EP073_01330 [Geovibrio thiophilus]
MTEPNDIKVVNPEFRHYAEPDSRVLDILMLSVSEWKAMPFYARVHANEFYLLLCSLDIKPRHILEWGSGYSTYLFSYFAGIWGTEYILSIDDNKKYQDDILEKLRPSQPYLEACSISQTGQIWPWDAEEYNYATFPFSTGKKFDLVFVDGRRRNECMFAASRFLAEKGLVILHDSWRKRYELGMSLFRKIKIFDEYTIMVNRNTT